MEEKTLKLSFGENHVSSNLELTLSLDPESNRLEFSHFLKLTSNAGHECRDAAYREATSATGVTITSKELERLAEFFTRAWLQVKDSKT